TKRKYIPSTASRHPVHAIVIGAVNAGISQPSTRLPTGMPPRNATLYTLITRPRISSEATACTNELTIDSEIISATPDRKIKAYDSGRNLDKEKRRSRRPHKIRTISTARPWPRIFPTPATTSAPHTEPAPE